MRTTADVVIIGGGIQGVSALYHLAESGVHNVVLLEMETVGSGTTAYTAAWVWQQVWPEIAIRFSLMCFAEYRRFKEKFGVDIGFRQKGSLLLDTIEHSEELRGLARLLRSLGVPTEILDVREIESIGPFLNLSDIEIGLFCAEDAVIDHEPFLQTYVKRAKRFGAEVAEGVRAIDIVVRGGRVVGVETTHGTISAPVVVNAAGIYDKTVGKWIGLDIPTVNFKLHSLITEPTPLITEDLPMISICNPVPISIEGRGERAELYVGCDETDSFAHAANLQRLVLDYGEALDYRMPEMANLGIEHCQAGIRSDSSDLLPILGPVEGVEGYINDCGWGGSGVAHAPVGGQLIAECILGTNELPVSIDHFLLKRFQSGDKKTSPSDEPSDQSSTLD